METSVGAFIPYGRHQIDEADIDAVVAVLRSGALTQGPKIAEFETALASYVGAKYAVAVSSGTAALHLACLAVGVGPETRTITSPNTFVATANCGVYVGASPDFADIDPATANIDPASLEAKFSKGERISAILPVHFAGAPCDMPLIRAIAKRHGAAVIEDAAHALGAVRLDGAKVGDCLHSDATIFSFHPVKLIAAGEGGAITTNREDIYRKLLALRSHGIEKSESGNFNPYMASTDGHLNPWYYEMRSLGFHYRITDIQCALALSQLKKIDKFLARRRQLVAAYDTALKNLEWAKQIQTAQRMQSAHHLYVLRIDFKALGLKRAEAMARLTKVGVGTQVHYIPVHLQPFYQARGFKRGDFPKAEDYYEHALSLPLYPAMTDDDQRRVIEAVKGLAA